MFLEVKDPDLLVSEGQTLIYMFLEVKKGP